MIPLLEEIAVIEKTCAEVFYQAQMIIEHCQVSTTNATA